MTEVGDKLKCSVTFCSDLSSLSIDTGFQVEENNSTLNFFILFLFCYSLYIFPQAMPFFKEELSIEVLRLSKSSGKHSDSVAEVYSRDDAADQT